MAPKAKRQLVRRRLQSRDQRAISAIGKEFANLGPAVRLGALLAEHDAATRSGRIELSPAARRLRAQFQRDGKALAQRVSEELKIVNDRWKPVFDKALPPPRDLLHVFGPDVEGTKGKWFYRLAWGHVEDFAGAGIGASADVRTGKYWASHYTTGPQRRAYAGVGVWLTPVVDSCFVSIRPYVNWSGFDLLAHRVFDPQLNEQRWATALGDLGIIVQSWDLSGKGYYVDARHWINVWERTEVNPSGSRDYDGIASSGTGLQVQILGSSQRQYAIWVCCRATVLADPGFAVATRASSSVSCQLPFLVVEEIPI
ncbi:MAG TPA: hypothetical protein VGL03_00565 [Thermoanaerobaculia bacterium]|jgi:hypothetical protein